MTWLPRRSYGRLALALLVLVLAGCDASFLTRGGAPTPTPSPTARPKTAMRTWYEAALREGEVQVYADVSPREAEALEQLLGERYPGITVRWTRGLDRELLRRVLAEDRDGVPRFDVFLGDAGTILKSAGLADRWRPSEVVALRPEHVDPDGAWYGAAATYYVLQYHIELVPYETLPKRYVQLAAPQFFGRLAIEEEPLTWLKGLVEVWGREATIGMLEPLGRQAVVQRHGPQTLADFVSAGRHSIAITNRIDAVERDRRAGAKTAWVPIEPVIVQPTATVVSVRAGHPNAARLFANFLLSTDAQILLAQLGRIPTRRDVDPEPPSGIRGLRTHFTLPPEGDAEAELRALNADLWRPR